VGWATRHIEMLHQRMDRVQCHLRELRARRPLMRIRRPADRRWKVNGKSVMVYVKEVTTTSEDFRHCSDGGPVSSPGSK
jgi:hypothetical protein